ncbi:Ppx/GppA phosphatase family protein [Shouchella lehensis]|uniref:Phosphatase n=1 Tax=Shouchella lehensis G1 TaxID=1246626 RepID=A0A060M618_9BACI|nr:hypothetical protein [Shouchella lehensis]AIC95988.1 phosphatase [Shouchella lehensis G1]
MHYVSIIEIGSTSITCTICKKEKGLWCTVARKKAKVQLVDRLSRQSILLDRGIKKISWALQQFKKVEEAYVCRGSFVFATGVLRLAKNRFAIVEEIKKKLHITIHILSGHVEAALGYLALKDKTVLDQGVLVDTGGASTELTVISQSRPAYFHSYSFGASTLSKQFFHQTSIDWRYFVDQLKENLKWTMQKMLNTESFSTLVTIGDPHYFLQNQETEEVLSGGDLRQQLLELVEKDYESYRHLGWIPKHRMPSFKGGLLPLLAVIEVFPINSILCKQLTITEGIITALNVKTNTLSL